MKKEAFKSSIIDSSKFKKYRPLRYGIYFMAVILYWMLINPNTNYLLGGKSLPSISDHLGIDPSIIIVVGLLAATIAVIVHESNRTMRALGSIVISNEDVVVDLEEAQVSRCFNFDEIDDIVIRRRSSWQHEGRKDNYLVKFGSLVQFNYKGQPHEYEFMVESKDHNEEFEAMISVLKNTGIPFLYTSI